MGNVSSSLVPPSASPAQCTQAFFVLASAFIFSIQFLPNDVRGTLMDYGARRPVDAKSGTSTNGSAKPSASATAKLKALLARLTDCTQVPHSWFRHFYIVSVGWTVYWLLQFLSKGKVMEAIATWQAKASEKGMTLGQTYIVCGLMAVQGMRRLYESYFVARMGKSPMWVVHWGLGLAFYTAMGLTVWVEGSSAILEAWKTGNFKPSVPGHVPFAAALFALASGKQNECHAHLAGLKKYTLSQEGLFKHFLCPHYTCECFLYLALSVAGAPAGTTFNKTILAGLLFVTVNLGATAYGTKQWYIEKFGVEQVGKRWMMIPYLW